MSTEVAQLGVEESPTEATPEATEQATPETTENIETWKKRLAGKDQALTRTKAELEAARKEAEELRRYKAEKEQADLTEVEKLQRQIAELQSKADSAERKALRADLSRQYPLAFDILGELAPLDESVLADIEAKLASQNKSAEPEEPPARVDPNNPRRTIGTGQKRIEDMDAKELTAYLKSLPNPFA